MWRAFKIVFGACLAIFAAFILWFLFVAWLLTPNS